MSFKANYWNCTAIADCIRGTKKPGSATMQEWKNWEKQAQQNHPIRYWIVETGFNVLQDIVCYIPEKINNIRYYLNNRFYTKTHALTSTLPRGQFYEFDTRLLHCVFDELVNFVEIEKAWMLVCWSEDKKQKYAVPLSRRKWYLRWFTEWRCAEAGLEYLDWEISLVNDDWCDKTHPDYGKPTHQAITAAEIKELYIWWTEKRPARLDPYDVSGWSDLCDSNDRAFFEEKTPEENKQIRDSLDLCSQIEKQYEDEDEEMLMRLIKIRKSLWT